MLTFKGISLHVQRKNNEDVSKGTLNTEVLNAISHLMKDQSQNNNLRW